MKLTKQKEQWTPTSIQASFAMPSLKSLPDDESVILDIPLINLGWTFSVVLTRQTVRTKPVHVWGRRVREFKQWTPSTFAFHGQDSTVPWESTSMTAELQLRHQLGCVLCLEQFPVSSSIPCPLCGKTQTGSSLGTLTISLASNPSANTSLKSNSLYLGVRYDVGLVVTISECPFPDGLFQASSDHLHHAKAQAQSQRQSNDYILCRSLTSGTVSDVTFLTFDTRPTLGLVDRPLPIYAPLSILERQIDISSAKLQEESKRVLSAAGSCGDPKGKVTCEITCPSEYEYELDSDYDDEDAINSISLSLPSEGVDGASFEGEHSGDETKKSGSSVVVIESAEGGDEDSIIHHPMDVMRVSDLEGQLPLSATAAPNSGRTIFIKFAAHKTWHAFLWYCYTGHVRFGKLKSQLELGVPKQRLEQLQDQPPACSPKSMYRLADILGNTTLKAKALEAIRESLTPTNVVEEAFSEFTSRYPEVQDVQLRALMEHCQATEVKKAFLKMILKFHNMPHAEPMLSAFYDKLAE